MKTDPWQLACEYMTSDVLRTDAFKAAWKDWAKYRRERRSPLVASTIKRQIHVLERYGHDGAIRSIEQGIERGWLGLFFPVPSQRSESPAESGKYAKVRIRGTPPAQ